MLTRHRVIALNTMKFQALKFLQRVCRATQQQSESYAQIFKMVIENWKWAKFHVCFRYKGVRILIIFLAVDTIKYSFITSDFI